MESSLKITWMHFGLVENLLATGCFHCQLKLTTNQEYILKFAHIKVEKVEKRKKLLRPSFVSEKNSFSS